MICGILSLHHDQLAFEQQVAVPWILSSCTFSTVQDQRSPELQLKRETEIKRQARNQGFMQGGANEAKVDQTTETYFLLSDPFI